MTDRRPYLDRCADLMDAVALGDIQDNEFIKLWCELGGDWYDANTYLNMLKSERCQDDKCEPERN